MKEKQKNEQIAKEEQKRRVKRLADIINNFIPYSSSSNNIPYLSFPVENAGNHSVKKEDVKLLLNDHRSFLIGVEEEDDDIADNKSSNTDKPVVTNGSSSLSVVKGVVAVATNEAKAENVQSSVIIREQKSSALLTDDVLTASGLGIAALAKKIQANIVVKNAFAISKPREEAKKDETDYKKLNADGRVTLAIFLQDKNYALRALQTGFGSAFYTSSSINHLALMDMVRNFKNDPIVLAEIFKNRGLTEGKNFWKEFTKQDIMDICGMATPEIVKAITDNKRFEKLITKTFKHYLKCYLYDHVSPGQIAMSKEEAEEAFKKLFGNNAFKNQDKLFQDAFNKVIKSKHLMSIVAASGLSSDFKDFSAFKTAFTGIPDSFSPLPSISLAQKAFNNCVVLLSKPEITTEDVKLIYKNLLILGSTEFEYRDAIALNKLDDIKVKARFAFFEKAVNSYYQQHYFNQTNPNWCAAWLKNGVACLKEKCSFGDLDTTKVNSSIIGGVDIHSVVEEYKAEVNKDLSAAAAFMCSKVPTQIQKLDEKMLQTEGVYQTSNKLVQVLGKGNQQETCIIGDIHGCVRAVDEVEKLLSQGKRVICLGDYVDRGDSTGVLAKLAKLKSKYQDQLILIKGNHDQIPDKAEDGCESFYLRQKGTKLLALGPKNSAVTIPFSAADNHAVDLDASAVKKMFAAMPDVVLLPLPNGKVAVLSHEAIAAQKKMTLQGGGVPPVQPKDLDLATLLNSYNPEGLQYLDTSYQLLIQSNRGTSNCTFVCAHAHQNAEYVANDGVLQLPKDKTQSEFYVVNSGYYGDKQLKQHQYLKFDAEGQRTQAELYTKDKNTDKRADLAEKLKSFAPRYPSQPPFADVYQSSVQFSAFLSLLDPQTALHSVLYAANNAIKNQQNVQQIIKSYVGYLKAQYVGITNDDLQKKVDVVFKELQPQFVGQEQQLKAIQDACKPQVLSTSSSSTSSVATPTNSSSVSSPELVVEPTSYAQMINTANMHPQRRDGNAANGNQNSIRPHTSSGDALVAPVVVGQSCIPNVYLI